MTDSIFATRHSQYYFDDGSVVFQVEDTLFKLHRYIFQRSAYFKDKFTSSKGEGESDENPMLLSDVKVDAFVCLCRAFYPGEIHGKFEGSFEEWKSILELSAQFKFDDTRSLAIQELHGMNGHVVEKVDLARRYGVTEWLLPLYTTLCRQGTPLTAAQAEVLGAATVLAWAIVRERHTQKMAACKASQNSHSVGTRQPQREVAHTSCGRNQRCSSHVPSSSAYHSIAPSDVKVFFSGLDGVRV